MDTEMWVGRPILICVRRAPRVGICPPSTDTRTAKLGPTGAGHLWLPHDFEDVDVHAARANRRHPIGRANPLLTTLGSMSAGRARVHLGTFFWSQPRSIQTRDSRQDRAPTRLLRLWVRPVSGQTRSRCSAGRSQFAAAHRRHWCGSHMACGFRAPLGGRGSRGVCSARSSDALLTR